MLLHCHQLPSWLSSSLESSSPQLSPSSSSALARSWLSQTLPPLPWPFPPPFPPPLPQFLRVTVTVLVMVEGGRVRVVVCGGRVSVVVSGGRVSVVVCGGRVRVTVCTASTILDSKFSQFSRALEWQNWGVVYPKLNRAREVVIMNLFIVSRGVPEQRLWFDQIIRCIDRTPLKAVRHKMILIRWDLKGFKYSYFTAFELYDAVAERPGFSG